VFQVAAFDHWDVDIASDVYGVSGTAVHDATHDGHCHGSPASCAEAGGAQAQVSADRAIRLPMQTPGVVVAVELETPLLTPALLTGLTDPPRQVA
jgi:hypothetical protein